MGIPQGYYASPLGIALAVLLVGACALNAQRCLHIVQLESYQADGYMRAMRRMKAADLCGWITLVLALMLAPIMDALGMYQMINATGLVRNYVGGSQSMQGIGRCLWLFPIAACAIAPVIAGICFLLRKRVPSKKPIVYTKRMKRLVVSVVAVNLALFYALSLLSVQVAAIVLLGLQSDIVALAVLVVAPIEKGINRSFFKDAQRMLAAREDLIKIGITGSYGKTSVKFILADILGATYHVLSPPSSFNTPMGLTRVVRESLLPEHQVFLAEMGARHIGDIKELCELVQPRYGVLTSIGPQHLETFFSIENVAKTKFELIDALPKEGEAFFAHGIEENWSHFIGKHPDLRYATAGIELGNDVRASDVSVGAQGSSFTLHLPDGQEQRVTSCLLGEHNIRNIALCCAVAYTLGLTAEQIAAGVARIQPIEHRLQLLHGAGGNVVIDDAFNSNPIGAKAALDVLASFPGRKVVVTPGMVELGEHEAEYNQTFGRQMAQVADIAILVGKKRAKALLQGLEEAGFAKEKVHVVASLDEAAQLLGTIAQPGDVTLFENDLPDHYEG